MDTNNKSQNPLTFAVISSTIGRPELAQTILSVQNQTYPAKHYVFVDGEKYWQQAGEILKKFPNVVPVYLPMNTGKDGWINSRINAIAPYLVEEDIICFLDDDNFYDPNHIETLAQTFQQTNVDWVYSLRNFVRMDGSFICQDRNESIGFYRVDTPEFIDFNIDGISIKGKFVDNRMIDTNTYAFRRELALRLALAWNMQGLCNDRIVFNFLKDDTTLKYVCTDQFTVNYRINPKNFSGGMHWNEYSQLFSEPKKIEDAVYMTIKITSDNAKIVK